MRKWSEKLSSGVGYYLTIAFCLVVILLSAVYAKKEDEQRAQAAPISADKNERISDVMYGEPSPAPKEQFTSPTDTGTRARTYDAEPVSFQAVGLWRAHRAVDFAVSAGDAVYAVKSGYIEAIKEDALFIRHTDGTSASYRGLESFAVSSGDSVKQGDRLGTASARVLGEGEGILHVALFAADGEALDFPE